MSRGIGMKVLQISLGLTFICASPVFSADDEASEIDRKAGEKAEANAKSREAMLERLKAAGWKPGKNRRVREEALQRAGQGADNPLFEKSVEELQAMGFKQKQIDEIQRGKEQAAKSKKMGKGIGQLADEAIANPGSERIKKMEKARLKRKLAEERRDEKLGKKEAEKADEAESKRKKLDKLDE